MRELENGMRGAPIHCRQDPNNGPAWLEALGSAEWQTNVVDVAILYSSQTPWYAPGQLVTIYRLVITRVEPRSYTPLVEIPEVRLSASG